MKYLLPILLISLIMTGCNSAEDTALREGNEAFDRADYETALTAYREAQEAAPDTAAPFYNAGNAHYRQEAYDLAELRGLQALKNNEGAEDSLTEDSYFNLGNSYFSLGQFDKAVTAYEEVLWRNPQAIDAQHNLELALRMQEQQEEQSEEESSEDEQESGDEEENQDQDSSENGEDESEQNGSDSSGEDSSANDEQSEQEEQQPQPDSGGSDEESPPDDGSESPQPSPDDKAEESDSPPTQTQAPAMQPLTAEQAAQLLESAAQNNESLQQYLQSQQNQTTIPGARDW